MTWNYRIVKFDNVYAIQEVYYHEDKPYGCCDAIPRGDDLKELIENLTMIIDSVTKPPINFKEIEKNDCPYDSKKPKK